MLMDVQWQLTCGIFCIFLMTKDVEQFLISLLVSYISSFVKSLFKSFACVFLSWSFSLLSCTCFHIFQIQATLYQIYIHVQIDVAYKSDHYMSQISEILLIVSQFAFFLFIRSHNFNRFTFMLSNSSPIFKVFSTI